jgi:hypothetical protein
MNKNHLIVLEFIQSNKLVSRAEISANSGLDMSDATIKRIVSDLLRGEWILSIGKGKATTYTPAPKLEILFPVELDTYFLLEQDDRSIKGRFETHISPRLTDNKIVNDNS